MTHEIVQAERDRQIAKGFDAAHDDRHGREHLIYWAKVYAEGGQVLEASAMLVALAELDFRKPPAELLAAHDSKVRADTLEEAAKVLIEKSKTWGATAGRLASEKQWEDSNRYHHYAIAHRSDASTIRALATPAEGKNDD
jgi:hypothetical protein